MNSLMIRALKTTMIAAALTMAGTCAQAANFTLNLPLATQWGGSQLPAGQYRVTFSDTTRSLRLSGCGKTVNVLVNDVETAKPDSTSHVNLVAGTDMIRSLTSVSTGKTYQLAVSKASIASAKAQAKLAPGVSSGMVPGAGN